MSREENKEGRRRRRRRKGMNRIGRQTGNEEKKGGLSNQGGGEKRGTARRMLEDRGLYRGREGGRRVAMCTCTAKPRSLPGVFS